MKTSIFFLSRFVGDAALAATIKLSGAILTYFMFVAVAKITDEREFGFFAATFSLASLLAYVGLMGQHSAVLRFWPEWQGRGQYDIATAFLWRSLMFASSGLVAIASTLLGIGAVYGVFVREMHWFGLASGCALLVVGLGWSEILSGAMRAQGSLWFALLPKEVAWRAFVIASAGFFLEVSGQIGSVEAVFLVGVLLAAALLFPSILLVHKNMGKSKSALSQEQRLNFRATTMGLWAVTTLSPAISHGVSIFILAMLGPEDAGAFFSAQRTALLIAVALSGLNQVLAPEISRAFYRNEAKQVQQYVSIAAGLSGAIGFLGLMFFSVIGEWALGLFDPAYSTSEMWIVLMVLMVGQLFNATAGPTSILLQLTGQQNALLGLLIVSSLIGMIAIVVLTHFANITGAALGVTINLVIWNALAILHARRSLGIDPSILGLIANASKRKQRRIG